MTRQARFVVDEISLDLRDKAAAEASAAFERLALLMQYCSAGGHVEASDELMGSPCWGDKNVCDALYSPGLDRDSRQLLSIELDRCAAWTLGEEDIVLVEVDDVALEVAPAIARAHRSVCMRVGLACLCAMDDSRVAAVVVNGRAAEVHLVGDQSGVVRFFRSLFVLEDVPKEQFFIVAAHAFPRLRFHADLSFGKFKKGYGCRDEVVRHLSALDDYGVDLFAECRSKPHEIPKRLRASSGIDVSGESPKTRAGPHMAQRDVVFEGHTYRCEWHSKLVWNHDRIHFHGPAAAFPNAVLIGLFVDHLDV